MEEKNQESFVPWLNKVGMVIYHVENKQNYVLELFRNWINLLVLKSEVMMIMKINAMARGQTLRIHEEVFTCHFLKWAMFFSSVIHSSEEFTPYPLKSSNDRFYWKLIDMCMNNEKFNLYEYIIKNQNCILLSYICYTYNFQCPFNWLKTFFSLKMSFF